MSRLVFPDGYRDTGIFEKNTQSTETQEKNEQLKKMYHKWLEHIDSQLDNSKSYSGYNGIQYLTCFDSYLQSDFPRIMIFGREANSADYAFDKRNDNFKDIYRHDLYYSYEYAISHPQDSYAKHRAKTRFLQTRKLICSFKDNEPSEKDILSVSVNNLNKISKGGKYTPCDDNIDEIIYSDFWYNDLKANIFIHELNILRPTHLVFLCGKGYNNHIKRDFGKKFYDNVNIANIINNSINVKETPVSKPDMLDKQQIQTIFGLEDYECFNLIFAIHPSAHMSADIRNKYEEELRNFIEENAYEN